jgi:hypothetical protein
MHAIQGTKIALLIDFDNVILGVDDPASMSNWWSMRCAHAAWS